MEKAIIYDNEKNDEISEIPAEFVENAIKKVVDVTEEMKQLVVLTPKEGYQKKIDLIYKADDMSTQEKLKAIDEAENKYAKDLSDNASLYRDMMWSKATLILGCTAGVVLMVSAPGGRRLAKSIFKAVA